MYQMLNHDDQSEDHDVANREERRIEVRRLLGVRRRLVRPPEDVASCRRTASAARRRTRPAGTRRTPSMNRMTRARPPRRRDALHRDEHDAGVRQRREEQPVRVERAPRAIRSRQTGRSERSARRSRTTRASSSSATSESLCSTPRALRSATDGVSVDEGSRLLLRLLRRVGRLLGGSAGVIRRAVRPQRDG